MSNSNNLYYLAKLMKLDAPKLLEPREETGEFDIIEWINVLSSQKLFVKYREDQWNDFHDYEIANYGFENLFKEISKDYLKKNPLPIEAMKLNPNFFDFDKVIEDFTENINLDFIREFCKDSRPVYYLLNNDAIDIFTIVENLHSYLTNSDWWYISRNKNLTYDFMVTYKNHLDLYLLSHNDHCNLSIAALVFKDKLESFDWNYISEYRNLDYHFIVNYKKYINLKLLSKNKTMDLDFILKTLKYDLANLDWNYISHKDLDGLLMCNYEEYLAYDIIIKNKSIPLHDIIDSLIWYLTENDWKSIIEYRKSEIDTLRKSDWNIIGMHAKLDYDFIIEYQENLDFGLLSRNENLCLTEEIIDKLNQKSWDWDFIKKRIKFFSPDFSKKYKNLLKLENFYKTDRYMYNL